MHEDVTECSDHVPNNPLMLTDHTRRLFVVKEANVVVRDIP